ncbi:MAG: hypothetical protein QXX51_08680 [Candidatus Bathyarchaeia archaeon]
MYEFTAIFLLALLFIIAYFIGMRRNRKIAVKYAKTIKDYMSPKSEFVGFRPYSRGGFRALCKMKEKEAFTQIEMAVSLVDRENLMHYPLSLLTKDCDTFACWGFLREPIPFNIEILPIKEEKLCQKMESEKDLKAISLKSELNEFFAVLTSNQKSAKRFLSDNQLQKHILEMKASIKRLSLSKKESRVYLIGELREISSLKSFIDILMSCGEIAKDVT